jgi:MFS family permease
VDVVAVSTARTVVEAEAGPAASPLNEILRDIARGGLASLVVGLLVAGLGGRLVMRLATLVVPDSVGALTENGNRIGDITLGGSAGLIFAGLFLGPFAGTVWVVVSPWIPGAGLARAIPTVPVSVALGAGVLIQEENRDFRILDHNAVVVAMLVALVAVIGLSIAMVDDWLDRRLPRSTAPQARSTIAYVILTLIGGVLVLPFVVAGFMQPGVLPVGMSLIVVGLATLARWVLRHRGEAPPRRLTIFGRTALLAAVAFGFVGTIREVSGALGG